MILTSFASVFSESISIGFASDFSNDLLASFMGDFLGSLLAISRLIWRAQLTESETLVLFLKAAQLPFALFDPVNANLRVYKLFILFGSLFAGGFSFRIYCIISPCIILP